jgi:hypothetical protein
MTLVLWFRLLSLKPLQHGSTLKYISVSYGKQNHVVLRHEDVWWSGGIVPRILDLGKHGGEWSASQPGRFSRKERASDTHWI